MQATQFNGFQNINVGVRDVFNYRVKPLSCKIPANKKESDR